MTKESEGLRGMGDLVAVVTEKTGIKKVVDTVTDALGIEDCGCESRQEKLNVIPIPFYNGRKDS